MKRVKHALLVLCLLVGAGSWLAPAQGQTSHVRLEVAPGSKAAYRVREQLAGYDLPNDAVGTTEAVSGVLVLAADGTFDRERSRIVVDLTTLASDQSMRDNYVRNRTLETEKFPSAEFVPSRVQGLPLPAPSSGKASFQLLGDLTAHGVTRPVAWAVDAVFAPDRTTARATTSFPFSTFDLQIPKLARLLSVDDRIQLELDLTLTRTTVP